MTLAWQNPLPSDNLQAAQYGLLLIQLGVSKSTVQRILGFDPEEEMALSQTEDAQALINFTRGQGFPPAPPGQPGQGEQPPQSPFIGRQ